MHLVSDRIATEIQVILTLEFLYMFLKVCVGKGAVRVSLLPEGH